MFISIRSIQVNLRFSIYHICNLYNFFSSRNVKVISQILFEFLTYWINFDKKYTSGVTFTKQTEEFEKYYLIFISYLNKKMG